MGNLNEVSQRLVEMLSLWSLRAHRCRQSEFWLTWRNLQVMRLTIEELNMPRLESVLRLVVSFKNSHKH